MNDSASYTQVTGKLDLISRQDAIDAIVKLTNCNTPEDLREYVAEHSLWSLWSGGVLEALEAVEGLPSAQLERDIPLKPIETHDKAWGSPLRQAVCPKCDYYLGHIAFLDDYKGKRITYCEVCGQAIDWEGWEFDE